MPLKLDLKCGEKMIVNGAVLENVGPNAKILIHNLATVLREKEILTQDDAATPPREFISPYNAHTCLTMPVKSI